MFYNFCKFKTAYSIYLINIIFVIIFFYNTFFQRSLMEQLIKFYTTEYVFKNGFWMTSEK